MSKKYYEIYLQQHVKGSVEDDYETVEITTTYKGGRKDIELAKLLSKQCGNVVVHHTSRFFEETSRLDRGLANVAFVCYNKTSETDYNILYIHDYQYGKKVAERVF